MKVKHLFHIGAGKSMKLSFYSMCQYNGYGLYVADISIQEKTKSMNGIFLTIKKQK